MVKFITKKLLIILDDLAKHNFVHGNLRPQNIFLGDKDLKLADFSRSFEISKVNEAEFEEE